MPLSPTTRKTIGQMARKMQQIALPRLSVPLMLFVIIALLGGFNMLPQINNGTMSTQPLTIQQAFSYSPKEKVKCLVGRTIATALPFRAKKLFRSPNEQTDSFVDKSIMFHLRNRALTENRSGFLNRIHKSFWEGEQGSKFSQNCDHRFHDLFMNLQQEDYAELNKAWNILDGESIVEVGSNSGLLLQYLTQNLSKVQRAIGIDINPAQIAANQDSDRFDSRIQFHCADGQKWITDHARPRTLFVTNGGVLEYFPRENLNRLMKHISQRCAPSVFYASEPIAKDHDDSNKSSIPFGEELSFSHNYKDLFESNGFQVQHQRAVFYESWKMQATIAVTLPS